MTKLKVLDLFAGIGGFSLGLERTGGFETVAFCEIDKAAQKVLKKHWFDVPVYEDIKLLKGEDVGTIDVITGGFPCQDISLAGKGAGLAGERSGLWWEYHRLIKEIKPKYVIAENVSALRSRGLDEVLRSLSEIGYDAEWHCIPASAVGAPHRRDRVWIVAYPNSSVETDGRQRKVSSEEGNERNLGQVRSETDDRQGCLRGSGQSSEDGVAYSYNERNLWWNRGVGIIEKEHFYRGSSIDGCRKWWETEPNVGRVVDGVSGRVDRLKQLGNAVVPQIPELIGKAILMRENL
jgi:DNA (cytosine-5)-methyltransferase 1